MIRFFPIFLLFFAACSTQKQADLIVHNAHIYTIDSAFSQVEAFAVKDGKFIAVGKSENILKEFQAKKTIDAQGQYIYPGLIDAHCHFYGFGKVSNEVALWGATSFKEVVEKVTAFRKENPTKEWILGMGWDQNAWTNKEFPTKDTLDKLFPDVPVCLKRIDGHALLANQKALDLAKVTDKTEILGGDVVKIKGKLTGVLVDNAMQFVEKAIPFPSEKDLTKYLLDAQKSCFEVGLTSIVDAGLDRKIIEAIDKLQKEKTLKMRIYAMISADSANLAYYLPRPFYKTDFLHLRSFKVYADGALGSRGACLMHPYHDKPKETGFLLSTPQQLDSLLALIAAKNYQINTHCIGDSANRILLKMYAKHLTDKTKRWRIEHAQVVAPEDRAMFGQYGIIPSVQTTHATSDMYWAEDRLGKERLPSAYSYQDLLKSAGILANGSDFPIEFHNPLYGFYAAVARQDAKGFPTGGFLPENALTREQALKAMTIWAAYAQFEEKEKGSIEVGKYADFVLLPEDIMTIEIRKTRDLKVSKTFVGGECVFGEQ